MADRVPGWRRLPLVRRLLPSLRKRAARLFWREGIGVIRRDGTLYLIDLNNWADRSLLALGSTFEHEQLTYLLDNIKTRGCEIFLDIGANMGFYSMAVAQQADCRRIIAFEPDPRSFDRLRANALLNGLSLRIESRPVAVSRAAGLISFVGGPDEFDAVSRVSEGPGARMVEAVRLDDILDFTGKRIAIKMDIEEHESAALEGMGGLLSRNRCFLQVEILEAHVQGFVAAMETLGYRLLHRFGIDHYFANF